MCNGTIADHNISKGHAPDGKGKEYMKGEPSTHRGVACQTKDKPIVSVNQQGDGEICLVNVVVPAHLGGGDNGTVLR